MEVQVNGLAVLLATLSTMVVGSVWYAPPVFGNAWMKMVGMTREKAAKNGWKPIIVTVIVSALTAYVLAHMTYLSAEFFDKSFLKAGIETAFWAWLGFTAARMITHDAFEGRPAKLTLMNAAHELVTFMVMGAIIGQLGV